MADSKNVGPVFRPPSPGQVLELGWNRYVVGRLLGQGAFGATFECTDLWDNEAVMKVLVPKGQPYEQVKAAWQNEIQNLVLLRHPNITFVYDAFEHEDTFYIVMERCNGTLEDLFGIPDYDYKVWFFPVARCVLQALHFIHMNGYVHKDCHIGNVFWSLLRNELAPTGPRSVSFKVGDLGISRLESEIDPASTTMAEWVLPPERLDPDQFGQTARPVDVYHAALLLLAVIKGRPLTFSKDEVLAGLPRQTAEALGEPYGPALSRALRRHVADRTSNPFALWRELRQAVGAPTDPILPGR